MQEQLSPPTSTPIHQITNNCLYPNKQLVIKLPIMNINALYCYYCIHIPPVTLSEKRDKIPHKGVTKWVPFPLYPYPSKAENRPFSKIMSHFEICKSLIMKIIIFRCDVTLILNFFTRATLMGTMQYVTQPHTIQIKTWFH